MGTSAGIQPPPEPTVNTRLLALFVATMAGCGSASTSSTTPSGSAGAHGKPEIGTWGFDSAGMDTSVAPGQSFYQYANGNWLKTTPIPADQSNYGMVLSQSPLAY